MLSVDLGYLKEQWFEWCRARGVSPSQATREVVTKLMGAEPRLSAPPPPAAEIRNMPDPVRVRCELRFTESEHALLQQHADATAMSVQKWVVALVRAHISKTVPFTPEAQRMLGDSNYQNLQIMRSLGQLAKVLKATSDDVAHAPQRRAHRAAARAPDAACGDGGAGDRVEQRALEAAGVTWRRRTS